MKRVHFTAITRIFLLILLFECSHFLFASRLESQLAPQEAIGNIPLSISSITAKSDPQAYGQEIIVSMGDSITFCYGVENYEECYVNRLSSLTGLTTVNRAFDGGHSDDGAAVIETILQQYYPRYLTIYLGNNDAGAYPTDDVIANLRYMVERCLSYGTTPIIATLGPQFDDPNSNYDWAWRQPYINAINSGIRQLAVEKNIPLADIETALNWDRKYYSDSIHPNSAGHAIIAGTFAPFIEKCTYTINPSSASHSAIGGIGSVAVTTRAGCSWTATSNAPSWITVSSGSSGTGSGTVGYSVAENTGASRSGTISIAGNTVTINQVAALCTYTSGPTSASYTASSGNGSVSVVTRSDCSWTAISNASWITMTGGSSGTGNGTVTYTVAENKKVARQGTITVAGQTVTVKQESGITALPWLLLLLEN